MTNQLVPEEELPDFIEPIWERQIAAGETARDYAAFLIFAGLRPADRQNYRVAWREWTKGTDKEGSPFSYTFNNTANEWHWQERAAARDIHDLRQKYIVWAERDWEWREKDYGVGAAIRKKVEKALEKLDDDNLQISLTEAAQLAKVASELQAKAIPQIFNLSALQVQEALLMLPEEKRQQVIQLMTQKSTLALPAPSDDIVDGEYTAT